MAQPISSGQLVRVFGTAAGGVLLSDGPTNFNAVTAGANFTGTVSFYDAAGTAGTTATNLLLTYNNNIGSVPSSIFPSGATQKGLVAVKGGTTDVLVSIG